MTPVLEAQRLILRPLATDDAASIAELIGDWEVVRWLSAPPYPYALADAEFFIEADLASRATSPDRRWAMTLRGQFAGVIGIELRKDGPNLGYWLGRAHWGQRFMTEAASAVARHFFTDPANMRLVSGYFAGNAASWSIQERLGFLKIRENMVFNRPNGAELPHVQTELTRARYLELHP